ncbi:hypothetical protein BGZ72_008698 [Mortierella alpina]|nr:hypothetical protein BGZ72_008698 [Mortierella alpina]
MTCHSNSSLLFSGRLHVKPPLFQLGNDPIDWLKELNEAIAINNWDDRRALAVAPMLIYSTARQSFRPPEANFATFKDFEKAFLRRYQNNAYKRRAFREALNYRQAEDQDIEVFVADMLRLFERADITEEKIKCQLFSMATNDATSSEIMTEMPATLEELIVITREAYYVSQLIKEHQDELVKEEHRDEHNRSAVIDDIVARMNKLSCSELDAVLSALSICPVIQRGQTQRAVNRGRAKVICHNCHRPGHIARNCAAPLPVPAAPTSSQAATSPQASVKSAATSSVKMPRPRGSKTKVHSRAPPAERL